MSTPARRELHSEARSATKGNGDEPRAPTKRKPELRPDCRLMDPEEMTPEERWDEIAGLLSIMALPRTAAKEVNAAYFDAQNASAF
jgi:hypothetical protein